MRLDKFLVECGIGSRKEVKKVDLIKIQKVYFFLQMMEN